MKKSHCEKNKIEYLYCTGCDGWKHITKGYDKDYKLEHIIKLAIKNDCRVITKNGNGKWYIKAKKDNNSYESVIKKNKH